eukprot:2217673-Pyramimonas_sp.AAC.1
MTWTAKELSMLKEALFSLTEVGSTLTYLYDHERRRVARYYGAVPKDLCPPTSGKVWRGLCDVDGQHAGSWIMHCALRLQGHAGVLSFS